MMTKNNLKDVKSPWAKDKIRGFRLTATEIRLQMPLAIREKEIF